MYHILRNANEFDIPRARTSLVGRLPLCTLPAIWNDFEDPELIKNIDLRLDFKFMLKNHINENILTIKPKDMTLQHLILMLVLLN